MKRRHLLKAFMAAGAAVSGFRLPLVRAADYRGKLFVFVQADGGWDPTSFCDPKDNTPGEPVINHWAERDEVRQVGRIRYAPFAHNEAFFRKYHRRMLVINGVDAQTNSHTVGIVHNWSGRNAEGYPTTTALLAAALRSGAAGAVPELRGVLRDCRHHPLHANRQRGPAAQHRQSGDEHVQRCDLGGIGVASRRHGRAARDGAQSSAGRFAPPWLLRLGVHDRGAEGVCGCGSPRG